MDNGQVDRAIGFFSGRVINNMGIGSLKENLAQTTAELKEHGGVKAIKVLSEDEVGDLSEVVVEITRGNGNVTKVRYKLVKEQSAWKVNDVSLDAPLQGSEPLRPGEAVEDVTKWAQDTGSNSIKDWLQKRSMPPICSASTVDRNNLPDEVRYHDVDDPKVKDRLNNALKPVLAMIGCPESQGVILYKGSDLHAGNLEGGQVAVTPGSAYFTGSSPDESIFHNLAILRIFLAREIFRRMIPIEKPTQGLNEADMNLRQELKLDYMAGLVSLAIDKGPTILDRAALDIATYAKPIGVVSGTQGTAGLQQIQDVFGAANQNTRK